MKKILLLLILAAFQTKSQTLVMTQAAFQPIIGDTSRHYVLDTSYYVGGLDVGSNGSGAIWTYSNLVTTTAVVVSSYVDPTSVPSATDYAGCIVVQKTGPLNTYYKMVSTPSVQSEFMGVTSSSLNMNLTNAAINMRYPFTYGNLITDAFSGNFTFSLSGTASGNATVMADGSGTLQLPGGVTFTNVLRVKSYQNTNFNAGFITGNMKQTNYSWFDASQKFAVFSINYQSFSIAGGSPTISAQVLGNKNNFTIGMQENSLDASMVQFYPNPVSSVLNVMTHGHFEIAEVSIYSITGEKVKRSDNTTIDCSDLANGIYIAELRTEKGILRKKLIKE